MVKVKQFRIKTEDRKHRYGALGVFVIEHVQWNAVVRKAARILKPFYRGEYYFTVKCDRKEQTYVATQEGQIFSARRGSSYYEKDQEFVD